ncbi:CPXCG motif-containing cysteine-rich protein [Halochromatium glycolicum]|uniref:Restriction endonuclease n=1 Tax=Halochromatium glycolicum TaxID=85075 RepID=A0AAJ0X960_9GAMM|nr:CPXCG motif-containing cysteine-rich protein [Halochromatium glycolicum]MBK1704526.1 restriction endonuclease [Halochromatium glycolicum]
MLEHRWVQCPYCGETITAEVDVSAGSHRYIEDCPVCCRPIEFQAEIGMQGDLVQLVACRDDD